MWEHRMGNVGLGHISKNEHSARYHLNLDCEIRVWPPYALWHSVGVWHSPTLRDGYSVSTTVRTEEVFDLPRGTRHT